MKLIEALANSKTFLVEARVGDTTWVVGMGLAVSHPVTDGWMASEAEDTEKRKILMAELDWQPLDGPLVDGQKR